VNRAADWMSANLAMQGYCLAEPERRALWLGLRLSTGGCLVLTGLALMAGSPLALLVLAACTTVGL
jgi:hypothetical protein